MTHWNKLFTYNSRTGDLLRNGKKVGSYDSYGYLNVGVAGKTYKVHRIIWEMNIGKIPKGLLIDHINRKQDDNRLCNLRLATKAENAHNANVRKDNAFKKTGVTWKKDKNKYKAYITIDKKQVHLGYFDDIEKAIKAREKAERKIPYQSRGSVLKPVSKATKL